jgi:hypothetical protein
MQLHVRQLYGALLNLHLKNSHVVVEKATISENTSAWPSVIARNAPN